MPVFGQSRYSGKACKNLDHIFFLNIQLVFMQCSVCTSSLFKTNVHLRGFPQYAVSEQSRKIENKFCSNFTENYCTLWKTLTRAFFSNKKEVCALYYIKMTINRFSYLFCPNTGTKFREPYHSYHVIFHCVQPLSHERLTCLMYASLTPLCLMHL